MIGAISNYSNNYSDYGIFNKTNNFENPKEALESSSVSGTKGCQTCEDRRYVDGSDENVSLKSPTKVSKEVAAATVRAHEGEHVSNAYEKAEKDGGKVVRASVSIKTAICPECGDTYVAGGLTSTSIKFPGEEENSEAMNPYDKERKVIIGEALKGKNVDEAV